MSNRLTKFNPESGQYEYVEKAKTLDEFRAQRKAVIQKLGEYEDKFECNGNCFDCDKAIWEIPPSFVGDNRIVGCKRIKESEDTE